MTASWFFLLRYTPQSSPAGVKVTFSHLLTTLCCALVSQCGASHVVEENLKLNTLYRQRTLFWGI